MKRPIAVAMVVAGVGLSLLGILFLMGAAGKATRYLVAVLLLALGGVLAGLGVRMFKKADAASPEQLRAEILELARERNGEVSEGDVEAALGRRAAGAGAVLAGMEGEGLCTRRRTPEGSSYFQSFVITRTMRSVSRRFAVEESAAAEEAITKAVVSESYGVGLKINRFVVELSLEDDARSYIRRQEEIRRQTVLDKAEIDHQREVETARAALEEERQKLSQAEAQWDLERQRMKMDFYAPMIRAGNWQLLALQLANHPDDVANVAHILSQQRQADMERQLRALKIMLEEDALEAFEMEDAARRVLKRFVEGFGAEPESRALGEGEAYRALLEGDVKTAAGVEENDQPTGKDADASE